MFRETDEALMDAAFLHDDSRLGGHWPSRLPVDSALAMTTVDGVVPIMCNTVAPATGSGRVGWGVGLRGQGWRNGHVAPRLAADLP